MPPKKRQARKPSWKVAVVALGGNSLIEKGHWGTVQEQLKRVRETAEAVSLLARRGWSVAVTHGNGPQVGNLLLQHDVAKSLVPAMPLDVLVAETQGQIGYFLQQSLENNLSKHHLHKGVLSIVTQVLVDHSDPSFSKPTKPVGPFYTREEAQKLIDSRKWPMKEDSGSGDRRVGPSPKPLQIVERDSLRKLIGEGFMLVCCGGGGIPVIRKGGDLFGVEAVIDKDLASAVLTADLGAKLFVILTEVPSVFLNFGKKNQKAIEKMTLSEASLYLRRGEFGEGSMAPKIEAAIDFLKKGGERVIITTPEYLIFALDGKAGTLIVRK